MNIFSEAIRLHEARLEYAYQQRLAREEDEVERRDRIIENLCTELDNAKLVLGDRRFTFRERLDVLAIRLQEIREDVERIEL
jgi:hypothetical protein